MDTLQENSVMLHINECLYRKGIISQSLYDHAKSVIVERKIRAALRPFIFLMEECREWFSFVR